MKLAEYGPTLAYEVAFWMQGLIDPEYPIEKLGKLSLDLSDEFRAMAIMVLLVKADSDRFYHNLMRSGFARKTYLRRLKQEGIDKDHHRASGRYEPMLDVIAARDLELARHIAEFSPTEWQRGHEYEDDYCYAQILHRMIQETPPDRQILQFLEQFEAYLGGESSVRISVCRALAELDQGAFDEAFDALLDEREAKIMAEKERGTEDPLVMPNQVVFVEGLAILQLAKTRGLVTQSDYRYCPSLARVPMRTPFPGE